MILPVGGVDEEVLSVLRTTISKTFPNARSVIAREGVPVQEESYSYSRRQYESTKIIMKLHEKFKMASTDRVLGVTSVDLFVPRLNFVFGEAQCPGKIALISLYRLRPEFYGDAPNRNLFFERAEKEAVHELGHTLGLRHCDDSRCVMFFSNSIVDTDAKGSPFCGKCAQRLKSNLRRLGLEG